MKFAPKWTPETKRFVFVVCAILISIAVWYFSIVLAPLIVAVIIAYLLNPVVNWLCEHTRLERKISAAVVYITFLLILVLIPSIGTPLIVQQIQQLDFDVQELSNQLNSALEQGLSIGGRNFDIRSLSEPVVGSLDSVATWAAIVATGIAGGFIWAIFIFVVGFYFLQDANRFKDWIDSWVPVDYLDEFKELRRAVDDVWRAYFIGQVTLAVIVGVTIGVSMGILGVRSAFLLGITAALLELIPNWGYGISGTIGVLFAYFQGSSYIPLPAWAFALLVAGFYFVMWQIDTNYLVPRIIGNRLHLPPAVIIVGIIAGASVGGALGLLLAAPIIATVRVVGSYIYRRLLDLEPYILASQPNSVDSKPPANHHQAVLSEEQPKNEKSNG